MGKLGWSALCLLAAGCAVTQLSNGSDAVFDTPTPGVFLAVILALLSEAAGIYTELVMKKRSKRRVNAQNMYRAEPGKTDPKIGLLLSNRFSPD